MASHNISEQVDMVRRQPSLINSHTDWMFSYKFELDLFALSYISRLTRELQTRLSLHSSQHLRELLSTPFISPLDALHWF